VREDVVTMHRPQRNWGCRIHETRLFGLDTIVLENDRVRLSFLVGKGADLVEFNLKSRDLDFCWLTPGGIRKPTELHSTHADPVSSFIDAYPGGWQEVFPNGGAPAVWAGASYGQHGEVSALPWDVEILEDDEEHVRVRFSVRGVKMPCTIRKTVTLRGHTAGFRIEEAVTNDAGVPFTAMWGHHIVFGRPFAGPGARIRLPEGLEAIPHAEPVEGGGRRVASAAPFPWPHGTGPEGSAVDFSIVPEAGTASDLFYLHGFAADGGWYEILRPDEELGVRVRWDTSTMPYLWYWQEFGATHDWPWYGRAFVAGLEPNSSYPTNGLPDAVANGSALTIAPGGTRSMWLDVSVVEDSDAGAK
jgi:galactose mutarotase-like enzyme